MTKELGPKQIAWLNRHNPAFKQARATCGKVIDDARDAAAEKLAAAAKSKAERQAA